MVSTGSTDGSDRLGTWPNLPATRSSGPRRSSSTTTSTEGSDPRRSWSSASQIGYPLPADDADSLGRWFAESADSGSLVRYLETFDHTVAVMQTAEAIERVARECVADLAADGVVYAEVRYAPEQHVSGGLSLDEVVGAVRGGLRGRDGGGRRLIAG